MVRSLDGDLPPEAGATGVVEVLGSEVQALCEDEPWVGATLQQLLESAIVPGRPPSEAPAARRLAGWRRKEAASLKEVLDGVLDGPGSRGGASSSSTRCFVLREDAGRTAREELEAAKEEGVDRIVFVLGDHIGMKPAATGRLVTDFGARAVTLGPTAMLTSQCITALHYEMDRLWPAALSPVASWQGEFGFEKGHIE